MLYRPSVRERGIVALLLVVVAGIGLLAVSIVTVDLSVAHSSAGRVQRESFVTRQIAESAVAQALARVRSGGFLTPHSGTATSPQWVDFGDGEMYYRTEFDTTTGVSTVYGWGRTVVDANPSGSSYSPDDPQWDGTGYMVKGLAVTVLGSKYLPTTPLYFGNGGIERPLGGFEWDGGTDPFDPSTWASVTGSPSSWQTSSIPFSASALDHPVDYLYGGAAPPPATSNPHPFQMWASQNPIGQSNIEAWFNNSAGAGYDPTINLDPPPTSSYYDVSDPNSPDYPYPIDPNLPDVQTWAWDLWNEHSGASSTNLLSAGSHNGTYGDLANPSITFVTGKLQVDAGETLKGAGILVIRDDYDPNVDSNNLPSDYARLEIYGQLEWTGLVVVAGWRPYVRVRPGGDMNVVGAFMGEDSVQSGGEISLDSATIIMKVQSGMNVAFSNGVFQPGGLIYDLFAGRAESRCRHPRALRVPRHLTNAEDVIMKRTTLAVWATLFVPGLLAAGEDKETQAAASKDSAAARAVDELVQVHKRLARNQQAQDAAWPDRDQQQDTEARPPEAVRNLLVKARALERTRHTALRRLERACPPGGDVSPLLEALDDTDDRRLIDALVRVLLRADPSGEASVSTLTAVAVRLQPCPPSVQRALAQTRGPETGPELLLIAAEAKTVGAITAAGATGDPETLASIVRWAKSQKHSESDLRGASRRALARLDAPVHRVPALPVVVARAIESCGDDAELRAILIGYLGRCGSDDYTSLAERIVRESDDVNERGRGTRCPRTLEGRQASA